VEWCLRWLFSCCSRSPSSPTRYSSSRARTGRVEARCGRPCGFVVPSPDASISRYSLGTPFQPPGGQREQASRPASIRSLFRRKSPFLRGRADRRLRGGGPGGSYGAPTPSREERCSVLPFGWTARFGPHRARPSSPRHQAAPARRTDPPPDYPARWVPEGSPWVPSMLRSSVGASTPGWATGPAARAPREHAHPDWRSHPVRSPCRAESIPVSCWSEGTLR
jgi:hypothetical protein